MGAPLTPNFMWAQRKDVVLLTINVPNVKAAPSFDLSPEGRFVFRGEGGALGAEREYTLDIQLFKGVKPDESAINVTARAVAFRLVKADPGPYWDRLLKDGKNVHMSVDWDNWKDEDEDDDHAFGAQFNDTSRDLQDMDFGAGDSDDSDDDDADEDNKVNGGTPEED
jgi:cytosolic prostaglandin-E synthase